MLKFFPTSILEGFNFAKMKKDTMQLKDESKLFKRKKM